MAIEDKLTTNPELVPLNVKIGNWLNEIIEKRWGKGTFTVSAQGGRLTSYRKTVEETGQLKDKLTPEEN